MDERLKSGVLTRIFCVFSILCDSIDRGEDSFRVTVTNYLERDVEPLLCSSDKTFVAGRMKKACLALTLLRGGTSAHSTAIEKQFTLRYFNLVINQASREFAVLYGYFAA
jgi:hypothetical protein